MITVHGRDYQTLGCVSENYFTDMYTSRLSFEEYYESFGVDSNAIDLLKEVKIYDDFCNIAIADFLTIGRDRHGKNIELLFKDDKMCMSPLFDNGVSLLAPYSVDEGVKSFDVMVDTSVNNFIGYRSLYKNLSLLDRKVVVNDLKENYKFCLFKGLTTVLPDYFIDKVWEIIWKRYNYLKDLGYIYVQEV